MIKRKVKIKLGALALACCTLISSTAFAGYIVAGNYTGTNAKSAYTILGNGTHYLWGNTSIGSATISAKKVNSCAPDATVAKIKYTAGGGTSPSQSFNASAYSKNGQPQSYYILFQGNNSSTKGRAGITH
ncbi:hypothetical protein [Clostridium ihumii]|uniref:hypothetical protein n=1 Tax=Clostridium ihumii TaxID=1470356 RepID=UPI00058AC907|nr:hypothetical protein [Clostridium ihumii]